MELPKYEYQGAFVQQWTDVRLRGGIVHRFQFLVKHGMKDAEKIVSLVVAHALKSLKTKNPSFPRHARHIQISRILLSAVQADPQEALNLVAFLIERESWDPEKKYKLRGEQMAFYSEQKKKSLIAA